MLMTSYGRKSNEPDGPPGLIEYAVCESLTIENEKAGDWKVAIPSERPRVWLAEYAAETKQRRPAPKIPTVLEGAISWLLNIPVHVLHGLNMH